VVSARSAERTLRAWRPPDPGQAALKQAFLAFLAARPDGCARSCAPGHLTTAAVVLDHDARHVLLTLHPRVGRWIQLGGHCEPGDDTLCHAALREATEESGIDGLRIDREPLHLDAHPITCSLGVPTRHLDVRFMVRAPQEARPRISAESDDLQWWPLDELPTNTDTVPELVELALGRVAARSVRGRARAEFRAICQMEADFHTGP
jgi:8-oxo-dGTP pyrophosphatase MutT (NUDIX family)